MVWFVGKVYHLSNNFVVTIALGISGEGLWIVYQFVAELTNCAN